MRRCEILRGGMEQYMTPMGPTKLHVMPLFEIGPLEPRFSEWLVFEGAFMVTLHHETLIALKSAISSSRITGYVPSTLLI